MDDGLPGIVKMSGSLLFIGIKTNYLLLVVLLVEPIIYDKRIFMSVRRFYAQVAVDSSIAGEPFGLPTATCELQQSRIVQLHIDGTDGIGNVLHLYLAGVPVAQCFLIAGDVNLTCCVMSLYLNMHIIGLLAQNIVG